MRHRPHHDGFTLLELLVACAMLVVVAGSLYASLRIGFRARSSAVKSLVPADTMRAAMDRLAADLHGAVPPTGLFAGPFNVADDPTAGPGTSSITFYAAPPETAPTAADYTTFTPRGDIQLVTWFVQTSPDGQHRQLMRQINRNLLATQLSPDDPEVVCDDVANFQLRCFDGQLWSTTWDSTAVGDLLPVAVEVTLELPPGKNQLQGYRLTRVLGLPCSKPVDNSGLVPNF